MATLRTAYKNSIKTRRVAIKRGAVKQQLQRFQDKGPLEVDGANARSERVLQFR
jgi:hypothetical protein